MKRWRALLARICRAFGFEDDLLGKPRARTRRDALKADAQKLGTDARKARKDLHDAERRVRDGR